MALAIPDLTAAVERLHSCGARFRESVQVKETFEGQTVWEGTVQVFDLDGHPKASVCYAWSSPVEGSDRRKVYAVLAIPPVTGPTEAVRAAIVAEHRNTNNG